MHRATHDNFKALRTETQPNAGRVEFAGFAPPTSNTSYTPNQFFDVCLPNASRGCVRIVAYLIRKTLGWCDAHGNPQREQIEVSHRELERKAGVSHDMIRDALNEALAKHFIECVRRGRASAAGDSGESALYALKWDATPVYARRMDEFRGFYEGEGHRTDIPNEFFDRLIPRETISIIKVVGAVIRYSIGFQAKHGRRRQQATLAYSQILKVTGLSSRRTLAAAIREAIGKNYIVRLDPGYFSAKVSERRSATYCVRWSDAFQEELKAPTTGATDQKRIPAWVWINPSEKDTSDPPDRSDPATRCDPKWKPADRSEKETIETKLLNEKEKQKQAAELLRREGFNLVTARHLAMTRPLDVIESQIHWMATRSWSMSRLGLLRRAIEGNWPKPRITEGYFESAPFDPPPLRKLSKDYLEWLAGEESAYRKEASGEYERFKDKRDRKRADLAAEPSPRLRSTLLARHDASETLLFEFAQFLALPDEEEWAEHINNQPFIPRT